MNKYNDIYRKIIKEKPQGSDYSVCFDVIILFLFFCFLWWVGELRKNILFCLFLFVIVNFA